MRRIIANHMTAAWPVIEGSSSRKQFQQETAKLTYLIEVFIADWFPNAAFAFMILDRRGPAVGAAGALRAAAPSPSHAGVRAAGPTSHAGKPRLRRSVTPLLEQGVRPPSLLTHAGPKERAPPANHERTSALWGVGGCLVAQGAQGLGRPVLGCNKADLCNQIIVDMKIISKRKTKHNP